jgi:tRNA(Ile)-lysidine synthase
VRVSKLLERFEHSIKARGLFRRGQKMLVAVSGGADSMALLHLLQALVPKYDWQLTVAHFNHQLRGRSSNADERLVRQTARKLGLPFVGGRADVRKCARVRKLSVEMAARKSRHAFLARTAKRLRIPSVATAHHADDQVELFFLRLLRGGGGAGLAGMKWKNPSPADPEIELVRPLLNLAKTLLLKYAVENKIQYREDTSNTAIDFERNRIRHELLPLLRRKYQPALDRVVLRIMELAGAEAEFVGQTAAQWLEGKDARPFEELALAVQRRCIQFQLQRRNILVDYDLVEHLRTKPGNSIKVSPELAVIAGNDGKLTFQESKPVAVFQPARRDVVLGGKSGEIVFGGLKIRWHTASEIIRGVSKPRAGCEQFDADRVGPVILLRHWRPGDRFQPIGMSSPVKLQDLFTNRKIPRAERHGLVVAQNGDGELFWVEKLRISERFKLSDGTNRRLQWQWKKL